MVERATNASHRHQWLEIPVYPSLLTAVVVINVFVDHGSPLVGLWRPLVVSIGAVVVVQLVLTLILRNRHAAAYGTAVASLTLLGLELVAIVSLLGLLMAVVVRVRRRHKPAVRWEMATRFGQLTCGLMFVLAVGSLLIASPYWPGRHPARTACATGPDIYLILLDGHPRSDTIRDQLGGDPDGFLRDMAALGFVEAPRARSNYNTTYLSLISVFTGSQVNDLVDDSDVNATLPRSLLEDGPMLDVFREAGYMIWTIPSPFTSVALQTADEYVDTGQVTDFELSLLRRSSVAMFFPEQVRAWAMDQHRDRIQGAFEAIAAVAGRPSACSRLLFAHVMSPHPPVAFAADGSDVEGLACFPQACNLSAYDPNEQRAAFAGQIEYVDHRVVETVRTIQAESRFPPVIVVFSDHGGRHDVLDRRENLRSLLLTSTPGHDHVFPDDATLVNLLARLANAYLGTSVSLASEESYWRDIRQSSNAGLLSFEQVDDD